RRLTPRFTHFVAGEAVFLRRDQSGASRCALRHLPGMAMAPPSLAIVHRLGWRDWPAPGRDARNPLAPAQGLQGRRSCEPGPQRALTREARQRTRQGARRDRGPPDAPTASDAVRKSFQPVCARLGRATMRAVATMAAGSPTRVTYRGLLVPKSQIEFFLPMSAGQ